DGTRSFDYGARRFRFVLGPNLKPMVREEGGRPRPELPRPGAQDDPKRVAQAAAEWKLLKQQIAEVVKVQASRLEQAMVVGRRWTGEEFARFLVRHPLMRHLVQPLIWGDYTLDGRLSAAFRV